MLLLKLFWWLLIRIKIKSKLLTSRGPASKFTPAIMTPLAFHVPCLVSSKDICLHCSVWNAPPQSSGVSPNTRCVGALFQLPQWLGCCWHLVVQCTGQSHPTSILPSQMPTWPLLGDIARPSQGWVIRCLLPCHILTILSRPHLLPFFFLQSTSYNLRSFIIWLCLQNVRSLRAYLRVYLE